MESYYYWSKGVKYEPACQAGCDPDEKESAACEKLRWVGTHLTVDGDKTKEIVKAPIHRVHVVNALRITLQQWNVYNSSGNMQSECRSDVLSGFRRKSNSKST